MRAKPRMDAADFARVTRKTRVPELEMYPIRDQVFIKRPSITSNIGHFILMLLFLLRVSK